MLLCRQHCCPGADGKHAAQKPYCDLTVGGFEDSFASINSTAPFSDKLAMLPYSDADVIERIGKDVVRRQMLRRMLLVMCMLGYLVPRAGAQTTRRCFNVPGIRHCIDGRFLEYWEQNGGLAVFGYPISPPTTEQTSEGTFLVQYFERNRFELHPEKSYPYDVLLGRLGADLLEQQRRFWAGLPKDQPQPGCLWFGETGRNVCDQEPSRGFKSYWVSHGLLDPALGPYGRSLALFGLPLSDPVMETNAAGDTVLTQWFERARLEYHPRNPPASRVLLGLLGNEVSPRCVVPLRGGFGRLWSANYRVRLRLGCPVFEEQPGQAAEQIFEGGLMYFWSGDNRIYVLFGAQDSGWWYAEPNRWREGEELPVETPPPGRYAPVRGFAKVWMPGSMTRALLSWGTTPETGMTGVFQRFERGEILYSQAVNGHAPRIYVLYDAQVNPRSALWETYPD